MALQVTSALANTLRDGHFVFNPVTGAYEVSTLLEGTRSNLALQSQTLDNAAWTTTNASVVADNTIGPDGLLTADKIVEDSTATATHLLFSTANITVVAASVYTSSMYFRAGSRTWVALAEGQGATAIAFFNLATGTVGTVSGTGSPSATITPAGALGSGWYRCTLTFTAVGTAARIRAYMASADTVTIYSGDGSSYLYAWGAQMELGNFASSYMPTVAATFTRSTDSLSFPFTLPPQASTFYAKFIERGTSQIGSARVAEIGNTSAPRFIMRGSGVGYSLFHDNGTATVVSASTPAPSMGDQVELRAILNIDGSVQLGQSINGAAETLTSVSAANTLATAWSAQALNINSAPAAAAPGFMALQSLKIALGVKSLAEMRNL